MSLINTNVIMSSAAYFSNDQPINPYYHKESIDKEAAIQEHSTIASMLKRSGVSVVMVDAPPTSQDGVYTANWGLIRAGKAVMARLPGARKAEEAWAENVLRNLNIKIVRVPKDWKFSGQGDALPCGEYLFCGSVYRSDEQAQAFVADTLGYTRIQLQAMPQLTDDGKQVINASSGWPDSFYYDIDLALSVIRSPSESSKGLIAYCPEAFVPESRAFLESFSEVDKIIVSESEAKEAFACNLVSTGEYVVMSARAPGLKAALEDRGLQVQTPAISELLKGGGYIRCTTLTLNE